MEKTAKMPDDLIPDAISIIKEFEYPDSFYDTASLRKAINSHFDQDVDEDKLIPYLINDNDAVDRYLLLKNIMI